MDKICKKTNCIDFKIHNNCGNCINNEAIKDKDSDPKRIFDNNFKVKPSKLAGDFTNNPDGDGYWMIHRTNTSSKYCKSIIVYPTRDEAMKDLMYLVEHNPGVKYYLLKSVQVFENQVQKSVFVAKDIQ